MVIFEENLMLRDFDFNQSLDLNDFIIKKLLSKSAKTLVFSARNEKTKKEVAIKIYLIDQQTIENHYQKIIRINSFNLQGVIRLLSFRYYKSKNIINFFNQQNFFSYGNNIFCW